MIVDLWFPATGRSFPADHGYGVYGALCRVIPELHGAAWWGLHTIHGTRVGAGRLVLSQGARLGVRIPAERIPTLLALTGRGLEVDGCQIRLAAPSVEVLGSSPALSARMVTIKPFVEAEPFREAVLRKLAQPDLAIAGADVSLGGRKIVTVDGRRIVGFAVRVTGLSAEDSLRLQEVGLGGRRRMGCGVFRRSSRPLSPDRRPVVVERAA